MAKKYYAVKTGHKTGIFDNWDDCNKQVKGFSGATYKSFPTLSEAEKYLGISDEEKISVQIATAEAVAYVDGSYNDETNEFSYGVVMFYNDEEKHFANKFTDSPIADMRNVAGEIKGAEMAMQFCIDNNIKCIDIYHDYEGISKWCTGEWKANKDGTKAYKQFYDNIKDTVSVNFIKVKGHSGDKYNDLADKLAGNALKNNVTTKEDEQVISNNKKVFIDRSIIKASIAEIGRQEYNSFSTGEITPVVGTLYRITFEADGTSAMLNLYFNKDDSTTIIPTGKNLEISTKIKTLLEERYAFKDTKTNKTISLTINNEWALKLIDFISSLENIETNCIEHDNPKHTCYQFKSKIGDKITFNIYPNGTLTIQGKPAYLYGETISFLSLCNDFSDEEIIKTTNVFYDTTVTIDETRAKIKSAMPNTYGRIDDVIFKLLSPSFALKDINIPIEDYSTYAFPALRALEGYLKYLFGIKNIQIGNNFGGIFENGHLASSVVATIADSKHQTALEKIYAYLVSNRHVLFHTNQVLITTSILEDKIEADIIVNEVINLIETTYYDINN